MRKSESVKAAVERVKQANIEAELEAKKRLEDIEEELRLAESEEIDRVEAVRVQINELCEKNGLFCGVELTPQHLANVVFRAASLNETIKIPFVLYFND
jgi:hypothetical protein